MKSLKTLLRMLESRSGATVIEYCLIAGIIAIALVGWATTIGNSTSNSLNDLQVGFTL